MEAPRSKAKRKQRHGHAQAAIGAQLHHHPGKQHGGRRGCGNVAGRRPGVQRPHAGEDREADKYQRKRRHLKVERKWEPGQVAERRAHYAGRDIRRDQPDQHHRAPGEGVEHKLHRSILAPRRSPDCDQKILRDNDNLVEHEEEKQIVAEKYAIHRANQQQEKRKEFLGPVLNVPGEKNAGDGNNPRQQQQR